ncbi:hypothetical protein AVEN_135489-1 [Araneus ventricosus]|uniref:Uncharacterized protein n=1 Tax=Araneus ventricosus TaxID=182803 RepID=A0A4Y2BD07_ARAVE|nr:hypothetical protein AVEN_135489-1 [Araneus ventricosus]
MNRPITSKRRTNSPIENEAQHRLECKKHDEKINFHRRRRHSLKHDCSTKTNDLHSWRQRVGDPKRNDFLWNSTTINNIAIDIDTQIPARRKGVDGFSVETAGLGKHPFSPSADSLRDAWAPTVHKRCHNQAFCGLCDAQFICLSTIQQQFHVW